MALYVHRGRGENTRSEFERIQVMDLAAGVVMPKVVFVNGVGPYTVGTRVCDRTYLAAREEP